MLRNFHLEVCGNWQLNQSETDVYSPVVNNETSVLNINIATIAIVLPKRIDFFFLINVNPTKYCELTHHIIHVFTRASIQNLNLLTTKAIKQVNVLMATHHLVIHHTNMFSNGSLLYAGGHIFKMRTFSVK